MTTRPSTPTLLFFKGVKTKEKRLLEMCKVGSIVQRFHDISKFRFHLASPFPNQRFRKVYSRSNCLLARWNRTWAAKFGCIIGYVAQHAFHHIDNYLDRIALRCMLWRYQTGEELGMGTRHVSAKEPQKMKEGPLIVIGGRNASLKKYLGAARSFEKEVDTRSAQRLGLLRPLIRREIEKHFGLDQSSSHITRCVGVVFLVVRRMIFLVADT